MNCIKNQLRILIIVIISLSFGLLLPTSTGFSQSLLRVNERIGGGGNSGSQQNDNSDNTLIFVAAGALVAGVIAYYFISKNKKKKKEQEADTTSALTGYNKSNLAVEFSDFEHELQKAKDNIPVNLIFGMRQENAFISDKTYLLGLAFKF